MGVFDSFSNFGTAIVKKTRLDNAVGIPMVFAVLVALGSLIAFCFVQSVLILILGLGLPVVFFIGIYIFILAKNPELLRTETHEEHMAQIAYGMGQKGDEIAESKLDQLPSGPVDSSSQGKIGTGDDNE